MSSPINEVVDSKLNEMDSKLILEFNSYKNEVEFSDIKIKGDNVIIIPSPVLQQQRPQVAASKPPKALNLVVDTSELHLKQKSSVRIFLKILGFIETLVESGDKNQFRYERRSNKNCIIIDKKTLREKLEQCSNLRKVDEPTFILHKYLFNLDVSMWSDVNYIKNLVARGANCSLPLQYLFNLDVSMWSSDVNYIKNLVARGANCSLPLLNGSTILSLISPHSLEAFQILVANGAKPDQKFNEQIIEYIAKVDGFLLDRLFDLLHCLWQSNLLDQKVKDAAIKLIETRGIDERLNAFKEIITNTIPVAPPPPNPCLTFSASSTVLNTKSSTFSFESSDSKGDSKAEADKPKETEKPFNFSNTFSFDSNDSKAEADKLKETQEPFSFDSSFSVDARTEVSLEDKPQSTLFKKASKKPKRS